MGLFRTLLAKERRGVRYLSDSAYWLYLAHLPLVIWAQVWIRNWDLPAAFKFAGLTAGISLLLLASYQLIVRYTPLGTLLNGQRIRPSKIDPATTSTDPTLANGRSESQRTKASVTASHNVGD